MKNKSLLLIIALLCTLSQGAWAEDVTFNVRSWDDTNKQVVTTPTTKDCTVLEGSHPDDWLGLGSGDDQDDHYYVVKGTVSYQTLNVFGKAHLILANGATLTLTGGLKVEQGNNYGKIYIYSQSDGDSEGRLVVTNSYKGAAGIGSSEGSNSGPIYIYGGKLNITGGQYAAGIGAGRCTSSVSTKVNDGVFIYGGTVVAQGGDSGAGIGGGAQYDTHASNTGHVYLYGGTVAATGGELAAGVGGGGAWVGGISLNKHYDGGVGYTVDVYGGTLTAQGGRRGAGIGSGSFYDYKTYITEVGGKLNVYAGTVNATGGKYGAGIGGGCNASGGDVYIHGGTVNAKGGTDAAGIGGGEDGGGGVVKVYGGTVRAEGTSYGAGIGGGECNNETDIHGKGAAVYITGGTVIAIAGDDCYAREFEGGCAIGCGQGLLGKDSSGRGGTLSLSDNCRVTAGDSESNIERVFTASKRITACRWHNYAKIEACDHSTPTVGDDQTKAVTYTIENDTHTMHCRYCAYTLQEDHNYVDNSCSVCLKYGNTSDDFWNVTLYRASKANDNAYDEQVVMKVVKGQTFTVPAVSDTEGLTLMGYATSPVGLSSIEMKDGETLTEVGTVIKPTSDMTYYPRYRYLYEPTWTWNNADGAATLTITCSALSSEAVNVDNISYTTAGEVMTATATYNHHGATYTFTDTYLLPVNETIALYDANSNEDILDYYRGRKVKTLVLSQRKLYDDGSWNTLCLPFDLSEAELNTQLFNPSALKTLSSSSYDSKTGTLTLNFEDATSIKAGKPYLIKWNGGGNKTNIMLNNVTINDNYEEVITNCVNFIGSYSPFTLEANNRNVLYLGADNTLYYPSADVTVGSCRAVFLLNGVTAGEPVPGEANVRRFVLNFDGETTDISTTSLSHDTNSSDVWYTLDGRRLTGKPAQHGIYINNGRKVIVK